MRRSSLLCRILAAARGRSTASFTVVPNRFLHAARYGTTTGRTRGGFLSLNEVGAAAALGAALGSALGWYSINDPFTPEVPPHTLPYDVILYQYGFCFDCIIIKVILDYCDILYKVVEVSPYSQKEIRWSEDQEMPILMLHGEQLNGPPAILDKLGEKFLSREKADSTSMDFEETKWRKWAEYHLVDVLTANYFQNASETLENLDYVLSNCKLKYLEKLAHKCVATLFAFLCSPKNEKKQSGITHQRAALYEAAETWVDALNGQEFLGGSKPNFDDLFVFGILRRIRYLSSANDLMEHTRIGGWYTRMESVVGESSRIKD